MKIKATPRRIKVIALALLLASQLACGGVDKTKVVKFFNPDKHATCERVWDCNDVTCWEVCK